VSRLVVRHQEFMHLFPWTDANDFDLCIASDRLDELLMFMLGIFGTKTSPPCICSMQRITNRTPCSSVIQKRVMRSSVTVSVPAFLCSRNKGMTLPRLPTTLP